MGASLVPAARIWPPTSTTIAAAGAALAIARTVAPASTCKMAPLWTNSWQDNVLLSAARTVRVSPDATTPPPPQRSTSAPAASAASTRVASRLLIGPRGWSLRPAKAFALPLVAQMRWAMLAAWQSDDSLNKLPCWLADVLRSRRRSGCSLDARELPAVIGR
eukprot:scaffold3068_cov269-Pinguiococcus_pyrenoidosus.AAC.3